MHNIIKSDFMKKRLFFGWEAKALWDDECYPKGKVLNNDDRHITLIFLGSVDFSVIEPLLDKIPKPKVAISLGGIIDKLITLPRRSPRVLAANVVPFEKGIFENYRKILIQFLKENSIPFDDRYETFLPHITLARKPFVEKDWRKCFSIMPVYFQNFHLYESLGNSKYKSIWHFSLEKPFVEISHTGDLAFDVYGEDIKQVFFNAILAISFNFPDFIKYIPTSYEVSTLEDIVRILNKMVSDMDIDIGSSFKAVSYAGEIKKDEKGILKWRMIVDV